MEQKLSRYQNLLVLLIAIFLHAGILLSLIIIRFDPPRSEAIILRADQEEMLADQEEMIADQEKVHTQASPPPHWVSIGQSIAAPPAPSLSPVSALQAMPDATSDKPEPEREPTSDQMQHAGSLAQELLTRLEQQEKNQAKLAPKKSARQELHKAHQGAAPTLAQITQGFVQQMQSPMEVRSNKQGAVSMEQLQHMHYFQKILACLINSYKIHRDAALCRHTMQPARVQLAINKDGSIHILQLAQSSGNITIDQFLISLFQDAGLSFPPLPSSFKEHIFYLPTFNVDRLEVFQLPVDTWYIDSTMP